MKNLNDYLNDLKEKTGSDNKSALLMGIDKSHLSLIRRRGQAGDKIVIKIADALGIDRAEVLIAAAAARNEGEIKADWEKIFTRLEKISKQAGLAASVLMACFCLNFIAEYQDFLNWHIPDYAKY